MRSFSGKFTTCEKCGTTGDAFTCYHAEGACAGRPYAYSTCKDVEEYFERVGRPE